MPEYPERDNDLGSLERARERLYAPEGLPEAARPPLAAPGEHEVPHAWESRAGALLQRSGRHIRLAGRFFIAALLFFVVALGISAYLLFFSGNAVSINNVSLGIQGPTSIAGGDTLPLSLSITNRNAVPLENATLEIDFPTGTRSANDVLKDYPRYTEDLGVLAPGVSIMRSVKAIIFGSEGQSIMLPISLSYSTSGSNAVFVKKVSYILAVSTAPLSVSVDAPVETVSGKTFTIVLTARSNASVPLSNVVVTAPLPFGFSLASSSPALSGSSFLLGTLAPGASRKLYLVGSLAGEDASARTFHFTIGTGVSGGPSTLAVAYMEQDATVTIAVPFISTTLTIGGDTSGNVVVAPGAFQSVTLSYTNTLAVPVTNATVEVTLAGSAVDYASIQSANGFYQSATHSIVFDKDTDSSLAVLAPGASGIDTFSFSVLPASTSVRDSSISFTTSVSGTRVGQANVPETVNASSITSAKVATALGLSSSTLHTSGPFANSGPIPPTPGAATTYTIVWQVRGGGNAVAGTSVAATLPSYVSYTGKTSGSGSLTYDDASRGVSWNVGDLPAGSSAQVAFQVSLTPSTSQRNSAPALTSPAMLTAFDRYAQIQISARASPATTETPGDPGYVTNNADVR